jgi:hypothetical protein
VVFCASRSTRDILGKRAYALILLARNPDQVRKHHESGDLGLLHHWLWCRLVDATRPAERRANRSISYERTYLETAA